MPTDGSEFSFIGVKEGIEVASKLDIPVIAIYVIKPSSYTHGLVEYDVPEIAFEAQKKIMAGLKEQGNLSLEKVKKIAEKRGVRVETRLEEGTPYEKITDIADEKDIIYMSSHGHSGLSHLFLGSTTDRVIKHTKCTVAVVRSKNSD